MGYTSSYLPIQMSHGWDSENMITYASGVPRDLGGISFQLVLGGRGHVWCYPAFLVTFCGL